MLLQHKLKLLHPITNVNPSLSPSLPIHLARSSNALLIVEMEYQVRSLGCGSYPSEEDIDVRKGPWTAEEDTALANYITIHGEGHWNAAARCAGLKRTGKSCRLRWLNYLRPDIRRGNISLQEQLLILELHSRWGNRWSKIAQKLPGRTDNEIKNYWRTRVQKHAKQLKCDVNSKQFRDAMRYVWIPRLVERIQAASDFPQGQPTNASHSNSTNYHEDIPATESGSEWAYPNFMPELSGTLSDSTAESRGPLSSGCYSDTPQIGSGFNPENDAGSWERYEYTQAEQNIQGTKQHGNETWPSGGDSLEGLWTDESFLFLQQQLMS